MRIYFACVCSVLRRGAAGSVVSYAHVCRVWRASAARARSDVARRASMCFAEPVHRGVSVDRVYVCVCVMLTVLRMHTDAE